MGWIKKHRNGLVITGSLAVLAYILGFRLDFNLLLPMLMTLKMRYFFLAFGLMFGFWMLESWMIGILVATVENHKDAAFFKKLPWLAIKTTLVGQYYSNITPFASGGQPMQLLLLRKGNVSLTNGTAVLVAKFLVYQVTVTLYALILSLTHYNWITEMAPAVRLLLGIGFGINLVGLMVVIILAFWPRGFQHIIDGILNLLTKLSWMRSKERFSAKTQKFLSDYSQGLDKLRQSPKQTLLLWLLSVIQVTLFFGITVMIYKALGLEGESLLKVITLQAVVYMCVSFIPIPGTVGASEIGFTSVLSTVFTQHLVGVAMVLWRLVSYYFSLLFCGLFTVAVTFFEAAPAESEG
jgi:hypothetical protein